eukprot:scaffold216692_cov18-Tisochrysis_lutea.AAC.2
MKGILRKSFGISRSACLTFESTVCDRGIREKARLGKCAASNQRWPISAELMKLGPRRKDNHIC